MYRLSLHHPVVVRILFFEGAFTLGHLLPRNSLYHYWIWFGAMAMAILTPVLLSVRGAGSASLRAVRSKPHPKSVRFTFSLHVPPAFSAPER